MDIKLFTPDTIEESQVDALWEQKINMDDWDYMLIFPTTLPMATIVYDNEVVLEPTDYTISRLLIGCCDNKWYMGVFDGEPVFIGIAYHS